MGGVRVTVNIIDQGGMLIGKYSGIYNTSVWDCVGFFLARGELSRRRGRRLTFGSDNTGDHARHVTTL